MSPWIVLEWVVSVSLSVVVAVLVIAAIAIGVKYLVQFTSPTKKTRARKPIAPEANKTTK